MSRETYCTERDAIENGPIAKGDHAHPLPHCFHDLSDDEAPMPALVCCFCGDLFEHDDTRAKKHGPYADPANRRTIQ